MKKIITVLVLVILVIGILIGLVMFEIIPGKEIVQAYLPFTTNADSKVNGVDYILEPYNGEINFVGYDMDDLPHKNSNGQTIVYAAQNFDGTLSYHDSAYSEYDSVPTGTEYVIVTAGKYIDSNNFVHERSYLPDSTCVEIIYDELKSKTVVGYWDEDKFNFHVMYTNIDNKITGDESYSPESIKEIKTGLPSQNTSQSNNTQETVELNSMGRNTIAVDAEGNKVQAVDEDGRKLAYADGTPVYVEDYSPNGVYVRLPRIEQYPTSKWMGVGGVVNFYDPTDEIFRQSKNTTIRVSEYDFTEKVYTNDFYRVSVIRFGLQNDASVESGQSYILHLEYTGITGVKLTQAYPPSMNLLNGYTGEPITDISYDVMDENGVTKILFASIPDFPVMYTIGSRCILDDDSYKKKQRIDYIDAEGGKNTPQILIADFPEGPSRLYEPGITFEVSAVKDTGVELIISLIARKNEPNMPKDYVVISFNGFEQNIPFDTETELHIPTNGYKPYYDVQIDWLTVRVVSTATAINRMNSESRSYFIPNIVANTGNVTFSIGGDTYSISANTEVRGDLKVVVSATSQVGNSNSLGEVVLEDPKEYTALDEESRKSTAELKSGIPVTLGIRFEFTTLNRYAQLTLPNGLKLSILNKQVYEEGMTLEKEISNTIRRIREFVK